MCRIASIWNCAMAGAILAAAMLSVAAAAARPHLVMVLADDLGWGNVGWNRAEPTPEVVTPMLDALVEEGIELGQYSTL